MSLQQRRCCPFYTYGCQCQNICNRACQFPAIPVTKIPPMCVVNPPCDLCIDTKDPSYIRFEEQYKKIVLNFIKTFISTLGENVSPDICRELQNFLKDNALDSPTDKHKEIDEKSNSNKEEDSLTDKEERLRDYFTKFIDSLEKMKKDSKKSKKSKTASEKKGKRKSSKSKRSPSKSSKSSAKKRKCSTEVKRPAAVEKPVIQIHPLIDCPKKATDECSYVRHERCKRVRPLTCCDKRATQCTTIFEETVRCKCLKLNFDSESNESLPSLLRIRLKKFKKKPTFDCDEYIKSLGIL